MLYEQGTAEYNLGAYDTALTAFEGAYRLKADPALLFNIAQCYRQLAKPDDAAREYRAYLRESPNAPNRPEVERLIEDMQNLAAAREANRPPTGVQPPTAPLPGPTLTPPTTVATPPSVDVSARPTASPRKRTWLWVTIGVAAAVVAGGAIGLGVGLTQHGGGAPGTTLGTFGATFQ